MKISKVLAAALAMTLSFLSFAVPGYTANSGGAEEIDSEIGFYVQAVIPENQIDPQNGYFDLRVAPGQQQTLEVEVVNQNREEITIRVSAVSVSTNSNGVLDYRTPGIKDATLQVPFSDIATVLEDELVIPASSSATARVQVRLPENSYDGAVLGGIVLEKKPAEAKTPKSPSDSASEAVGGAVITNVYSYSVAVKLTETDAAVAPDFEMADVRVVGERGRVLVVHSLRNPQPVIVKAMEMEVDIYRQGEDLPMAQLEKSDLDMAPNTVMEVGVPPLEAQIPAGTYTSYAKVRYDGQIWNFETTFVVDASEARVINSTVARAEEGAFPVWAIVLMALAAVIIVLLAVLLVRTRKAAHGAGQPPPRQPNTK